MAKRKNGLIEDRTIRQPMEQLRRKLKFKEKEKRKEQRQATRDSRQEFDPLAGHDSAFISHIKSLTKEETQK